MAENESAVKNHYGRQMLWESILAAFENAGKDLGEITIRDLWPVDMFHMRGRKATEELAALLNISPTQTVLDVGCGIGGPVRFLADRFGCRTVGIDITRDYVEVAKKLSALTGISALTEFHTASALDMPFENASFDAVWTEHVQMNIAEKDAFYLEIARVLKPGGRLVFHDVFSGNGVDPYYPLPWAEDETISWLETLPQLQTHLANAGFSIERLEDKSRDALSWFIATGKKLQSSGPPPLGIHLLLGKTAKLKAENIVRNLTEQRITALLGAAVKQ